jgi:prophage regulatory protein
VNPADLPPLPRCAATARLALLRPRIGASCLDRSRQRPPTGARPAMHQPDRIIRLKTVVSRTGLSRSTLYRKIAEGTFPAQLRISIHGVGWRESDIDRWVNDPSGWRLDRKIG